MFRLARRGVLAHKLRLTLTAFAIVLGVAFVSGTLVFTDSIKASFDDLFEDVYSPIDFSIRGTSEFGAVSYGAFDESVAMSVAAVPGVELAVPSVEGIAQMVKPAPCEVGPDANPARGCPIGGNGPPTLGFSYTPGDELVSPLEIQEGGRFPAATDEIAIDAFSAEENELALGDLIDVITPGGSAPYEIVGIAKFGDAENLMGATLVIFEFEEAQRVFDSEGKVTSVLVLAAEGVDRALLQARISDLLPEGTQILTGEEQATADSADIDEGIGFINTILLVIAGVAVFVGAFIIQNTFRIIVAQRTREMAMLRAVGATGRQVTTMVALEALLVGLVASAVGLGVGILFAMGIKSAFGVFGFGFPAGALTIKARTIVVGMLVGVMVTMVSALLPARKASRIPPIAALRDVVRSAKDLRTRLIAGLIVLGLGIALLTVGLTLSVDNAILYVGLGALLTFVGVSVLAPLFAREFARTAGRPLPRLFGVVGRLAQENAMRKPRRTAATASALMIGVALVSLIAVFQASAKAGVAAVFEDTFRTDFQVGLEGFANDPRYAGISPSLADELRQVEELDAVARVRIGEFRFFGTETERFLLGVDGPVDETVDLGIGPGSYADLVVGTTLMARDLAEAEGVDVGDAVQIEVPSGAVVDLTVVGLVDDDAAGTALLIPLETYEQHLDHALDYFIYVTKDADVTEERARAAIDEVAAAYPNANVTNTEELIEDIEGGIDQLLNLLVVLLAFAIVIALLGIVNTLVLSVSERRREIGLLRAVGMSRRQVRYMIRLESLLIAVFGGVLGLVVGTALGVAAVAAVGSGLKIAIPGGQLIIYLILAGIGGVIAAIAPARRGAKTNMLEAIAYE